MWWHLTLTLVLGRQRKEDQEFKVNFDNIFSLRLPKTLSLKPPPPTTKPSKFYTIDMIFLSDMVLFGFCKY